YYMDSNRSIAANPLVKYILSITDILRNNFRQEDVLKLLRTGLSPLEEDEIDELENYIYARGIKGIAKWREDFVYTSEEQRLKNEPIDKINSVRAEFFAIFKGISADGTGKRKLSKWIEQIYSILESGKIYEKMNEMAEELREEGLIGEAMEYAGVYNKVIELFDALSDLMGDEDYSIKELSDILKVGFSEIRVGVLPQKVDSLLVGDMQRTRLKETKELFILGVNDGNIPKGASDGGLLSVPDKEELKKAECRLAPTSVELAFIEQLYIYLNLTKPTDKLYLSFASVGGKGEGLIPSYLIEVLKNMFEGLEVTDNTSKTPEMFLQDIKEETGRLLGLYVTGIASNRQEEKLFNYIGIIKGSEGGEEWCEKVISNAFREYKAEPLDKETARDLYGDLLTVSVSTLERFAACRYAHFVAYGLALKEREEYGLESVDMGNLSHDVLERVGQKLQSENLDFSTADEEEMIKEIDAAIEHLTDEYNGDLLVSDEKTKYYARQLQRIMRRTVKTLGFQLSKGKYKPEMYETAFKTMYDLSSDGAGTKRVILKGRIDRADVFDDEKTEYVKIIDYKSSSHKLDAKKLEEGLSLQLAIYMKNAIEMIKERYPGKEVLPAAMLYYAIDDPFSDKREEYEAEIRKQLIPVGAVVNDDKILESLDETLLTPGAKSEVIKVSRNKDKSISKGSNVCSMEEFNSMLEKAEEKAKELASDVLSGSIDINPYYEKKEDYACRYCALKGICGFDPKIKGYEYRQFGEAGIEEDEE
ncbi:MAG: PD-(D/E)XK nuclease family protein, partial [Lachnospiraceae bacterium]|nr:PD-(D/E)XK nuclease family protein [Lachnospiraceae bacterium]